LQAQCNPSARCQGTLGHLAMAALLLLAGCRSQVINTPLPTPPVPPPTPYGGYGGYGYQQSGPYSAQQGPPVGQSVPVPVYSDPRAGFAGSAPPLVADPYVTPLVEVLDQTKSIDAFLVSVQLLAEVRPTPRQAIPKIIRNAERLGIYGEHGLKMDSPKAKVASELTALLLRMSKDRPSAAGAALPRPTGPADAGDASNADPNTSMEQMPFASEDLRQIEGEWRRFWLGDMPSHLIPDRVGGGIAPDAAPTVPVKKSPQKSSSSGSKRGPAGQTGPAAKVSKLASGWLTNPFGIFTPIPIQPWVSQRIEERTVHRTPVLPPIPRDLQP
jgi:hypothetical protein